MLFSVSYSIEVMKCDVIPDIFSTCSILSIVCVLYRKFCGSGNMYTTDNKYKLSYLHRLFTITNQLTTIYN